MPDKSTSTSDIIYGSSQWSSQPIESQLQSQQQLQSQASQRTPPASPPKRHPSGSNPQFSPSQLSSISLSSVDTYYSAFNDETLLVSNSSQTDRYIHANLIPSLPLPRIINSHSYQEYLTRVSNGSFITLARLSHLLDQANSHPQEDVSQMRWNVIAVVYCIASTNSLNDCNRILHLIDPSLVGDAGRLGLRVKLRNSVVHIPSKNIVRLTNVHLEHASQQGAPYSLSVIGNQNFGQIHAFQYDYETPDVEVFSRVFQINHSEESISSDISMAFCLEEWFSHKCLANCLSSIPIPTTSAALYFDVACLVIGVQLMKQSCVLTVWDGNKPNVRVLDQFNMDYAIEDSHINSYHRFNRDEGFGILNDYFSYINVWANESNNKIDHYGVASTMTLEEGDDLLMLFNVEVRLGEMEESVRLTIRSGRQYGRGVRKVSRRSVLGKKMMNAIREAKLSLGLES